MRCNPRYLGLFTALLLYFLFPAPCESKSDFSPFGLVYIESNTGGASGGHCGLRLKSVVFHLQQQDDGFFKLVRQPWDDFLHVYNDIENRPVHFANTQLPSKNLGALETYFLKLLLAQNRNFENLQRLKTEAQLLEGLLKKGTVAISVKGLGFFEKAPTGHCFSEAARVKKLVEREMGPDFFKVDNSGGPFQAFPQLVEPPKLPMSKVELVPIAGILSSKVQDDLSLKMFKRVISGCLPLRKDVLMDGGPIERSLKRRIEGYSRWLEKSIVTLLASSRPDRGNAALLQLARLYAVRKSILSGRLLMLDTFPDDCQAVGFKEYKHDLAALGGLLRTLEKRLRDTKEKYARLKEIDQIQFNLLENLVSRYGELKKALANKGPVRIWSGLTLPAKASLINFPYKTDRRGLEESLQRAKRAYTSYLERLKRLYHYNLLKRNCVTELSSELNSCKEAGPFPKETGVGIPFLYFQKWLSQMNVKRVEYYPSYRIRKLNVLYEKESPLVVYLREFNTLTSTLYHPHQVDTSFLVFSDDVLWLRPLYGCINIAYAGFNVAAGLVESPLDGARRLRRGFWGVVYSVPELFMSNIRKGTFVWVPSQ